ncbi:hypothetical protein QC762_205190 [Podospora pseudocomata]|uniref:Ribosome biogenesis protein SLX9 n=1 Tax=Podospora pseudocomata TaxID=2093779 RepID=A0ABR0GLQ7_9PEZI|nr:hypothetical protein QC762_205190 [Podospora pseudocomata]
MDEHPSRRWGQCQPFSHSGCFVTVIVFVWLDWDASRVCLLTIRKILSSLCPCLLQSDQFPNALQAAKVKKLKLSSPIFWGAGMLANAKCCIPATSSTTTPPKKSGLARKYTSIRNFRPPINTKHHHHQTLRPQPLLRHSARYAAKFGLFTTNSTMAKPTISKGKKGPSKHSRASRREEPIDINTDKSLKSALPPPISTDHHRPAVLAAQLASSVSKPTRKTGRKAQLSSKARKRQERSMDMAEAVMERTITKIEKSKGHAKVINTRRKPWEEINNDVFGEGEKAKKLTKKQLEKQREDEIVRKFFDEGAAEKDEDGNVEMEGAASEGGSEGEGVPTPVQVMEEVEEVL